MNLYRSSIAAVALSLTLVCSARAEVDKPGTVDPTPPKASPVDLYAPSDEKAMADFISQLKNRSNGGASDETSNVVLGDATGCRQFMESMVDDAARAKSFTPDANRVMEAHIGQFMRLIQPFIPVNTTPDTMQSAYRFMTAQTSRYCLAHPDARLEVAVTVAGKTLSTVIAAAENEKRTTHPHEDGQSPPKSTTQGVILGQP